MKFRQDQPVIYLSGFFSQVKESSTGRKMSLTEVVNYWRKKSGAKYRCYSFPYVGADGFYLTSRMVEVYRNSLKHGDGILMDSGAHSFHNFVKAETGKISSSKRQKMTDVGRLRDQTIDAYLRFIKQDGKKWDCYVNFDYTHDADKCFKMQQRFWDAGTDPVPVFHGMPNTLDYFKRYADKGAKLIGLGTGGIQDRKSWDKKRFYFDLMFNEAEKYGVKLHGFAVTSLSLMFQYPWYSVDSSTWAKCSAYGKILFPDLDRNILRMVHVSSRSLSRNSTDVSYNRMPKDMRREFAKQVEAYGYNVHDLAHNLLERYCFNAAVFAKHVHELKESVKETRARWKSLLS